MTLILGYDRGVIAQKWILLSLNTIIILLSLLLYLLSQQQAAYESEEN